MRRFFMFIEMCEPYVMKNQIFLGKNYFFNRILFLNVNFKY